MTNLNFIEDMADYVATGTPPAVLVSAEHLVGAMPLRQICIGLLGWLKARARFPRMTTMKTSEVGSSANLLLKLLETDASFSSLFVVRDGCIQLHENVSDAEINGIVSAAAKLYHPSRFTTRRGE